MTTCPYGERATGQCGRHTLIMYSQSSVHDSLRPYCECKAGWEVSENFPCSYQISTREGMGRHLLPQPRCLQQ